ncbi:hypothetical protein RUND412_009077 [Rhizina undulata]
MVALVSLLAPTRRPRPEGSHEPPRARWRNLSQLSELQNVVTATATGPTPASKTMAKPSEPAFPSRGKLNHPRIASILGVDRRDYVPLMVCRGLLVCLSLFGLLKCFLAIWRDMALQCSTAEVWLAIFWVMGTPLVPPRGHIGDRLRSNENPSGV